MLAQRISKDAGSDDGSFGEVGIPYAPQFKKELSAVAAALGPGARVRFNGDKPAEIFDGWRIFARITMFGNGKDPAHEALVVSREQLPAATQELFTRALPTLSVRFEVQG